MSRKSKTDKNKGDMTVAEAGRRGGRKVASQYDHEHFVAVGRKGGRVGGPRVRELIAAGKKALGQ